MLDVRIKLWLTINNLIDCQFGAALPAPAHP